MKKKISTIALALVAAAGIGAAAQTATPATCGARDGKPRCEKQRPDRAKADSVEMAVLFEGITLTPEQQTKLATLKKNRAESRKTRMEAGKQQRDENRAKMREERKNARKQNLADMKQVLTPEQYVVYLENVVVNAPDNRMPAHGNMHRGNKARDGKALKADARRPARNAQR